MLNLLNLRHVTKLSQTQLAQRLGLSRPTYASLEKGKRQPTQPELEKLAQIFSLSTDDLQAGKLPVSTESIARDPHPQENIAKFKEVLLYILRQVGARPNVGQTVLYKLLYFIDFDYYEKYEEQLIGLRYRKNHFGPTPDIFKKVVRDMQQAGDLEEVKSQSFIHDQTKYLPHRDPDLDILKPRELEHIREVLRKHGDKTATFLSNYSHGDVPWLSHELGEIIDYETVFYRNNSYSVRDDTDNAL